VNNEIQRRLVDDPQLAPGIGLALSEVADENISAERLAAGRAALAATVAVGAAANGAAVTKGASLAAAKLSVAKIAMTTALCAGVAAGAVFGVKRITRDDSEAPRRVERDIAYPTKPAQVKAEPVSTTSEFSSVTSPPPVLADESDDESAAPSVTSEQTPAKPTTATKQLADLKTEGVLSKEQLADNTALAEPNTQHLKPAESLERPTDKLAAQLTLLRQARSQERNGNPGEAMALLDRLEGEYPESALKSEISLLRVRCFRSLGRESEGIALLDQLLLERQHQGRRAELLHVKGDLQLRRGDCTNAVPTLRAAIAAGLSPERERVAKTGIAHCQR
jgi:predicted negative regulator of RcsB-dependent stress response